MQGVRLAVILTALLAQSCVMPGHPTDIRRNGAAGFNIGAARLTGSDADDAGYDSTYLTASVHGRGTIMPHMQAGAVLDVVRADSSDVVLGFPIETDLLMFSLAPMFYVSTDSFMGDPVPYLTVGVGPRITYATEEIEVLGLSDDEDDIAFGAQAELIGGIPVGSDAAITLTIRYAFQDFSDFDATIGVASALLGVEFRW